MKLYLIRHGATLGNLEKRYIGTTDEPLCEAGIYQLKQKLYPEVERIYVSPMLRCIQTAQVIYPNRQYELCDALRECDFGDFENKNYEELSGNQDYQRWLDSMGTLPFPNGESREDFRYRTLEGFFEAVSDCEKDGILTAAFVFHGGSIMNIMEACAFPVGNYYDYQISNGEGYELSVSLDASGVCRGSSGLDFRRPEVAVSSGADDWTSYQRKRKNYKKMFTEDKAL